MPKRKHFFNSLQSTKALSNKKRSSGFSLIEVVTVVAVLGILTTVAMTGTSGKNGILSWSNRARIDSAKAKLNSAAASCLQEIRLGNDPSQTIDEGTLSNELIASDGYKISSDMNSCASLMIESSEDDPFYFPFGFTISDGKLTKFGFPLSQETEDSCRAWAGVNCKAGEDLLELIAHNKAVAEAKTKCSNDFYSWLNGNPPFVAAGDGKQNRWNPTSDSDCKRVPPVNTGKTCETNGCDLETWAFEGTIVAGEEGYKEAIERKYGKICTEKLEKIRESKDTGGPVTILECGATREMWFYEGVDQGSEAEMNKLICTANQAQHQTDRTTGETKIRECGDKTFYYCLGEDKGTQDLMKSCISANKEASCQNAINDAISSDYDGRFVADSGGPGVCSQVQWLCKGESSPTEEGYEKSTCGTPSCDDIPRKPFCSDSFWWNNKNCREWAQCMKYI